MAFDELQEKNIDIYFFMGNEELVEIAKNELRFWFTEDALEYAEFKIKEFLRIGHISPAEFFEFTYAAAVKKNVRQVQTYFISYCAPGGTRQDMVDQQGHAG